MLFLEKFKNKKFRIIVSLTSVLCVTLGIYFFYKGKDNKINSEEPESFIETYAIPESEKVFINGIVLPKDSKDFTLSDGEEIDQLKVENGQSVKKGSVLFTCKNPSVINEINELKSQVSELKSSQGVSDPSISLEINKLNAQIKSLNENAYSKTLAPFDGKVFINEESESQSGFITLQTNEFYMKGQASEQDLAKIQVDQTAKVLILSTNKNLTGRISFISERPSTDSSSEYQQQSSTLSYYDINIAFDSQEGLVNGFHVQASIKLDNSYSKIPASSIYQQQSSTLSYYDINIAFDSQEGLVNGFHVQASIKLDNSYSKIPASSILESGDKYYVFKDLDGILKKQSVEIESRNEEFAVVKSGLKENDIILTTPTEEMEEGQSLSMYESSNSDVEGKPKID